MAKKKPLAHEIISGAVPNPKGPLRHEVVNNGATARLSQPEKIAAVIRDLFAAQGVTGGKPIDRPVATKAKRGQGGKKTKPEKREATARRDARTATRSEGIAASISPSIGQIESELKGFRAAGGLAAYNDPSSGVRIPPPPQALVDAAIAGGARTDSEIDAVFDLFLEGPAAGVTAEGIANKLEIVRRANRGGVPATFPQRTFPNQDMQMQQFMALLGGLR